MITGRRRSPIGLLQWQKGPLIFFGVAALAFVLLRRLPPPMDGIGSYLEISPAPLTILGSGMAIFVGFRTNSAYARWWDARRLWGVLVNATRMLATQTASYLASSGGEPTETQRAVITLLSAHVHALRTSMRDEKALEDAEVRRLLDTPGLFDSAERAALSKEPNLCHALLDRLHRTLTKEASAGRLDGLRLASMDRTIAEILEAQGGSERIKRTPMPPAYGLIAEYLTYSFGLVFPLALHDELDFWVVPLNMLVAGSFLFVNELGRVLEEPFTLFWNGLPLMALSRTIEANARACLGDRDFPPIPAPDHNGVLM